MKVVCSLELKRNDNLAGAIDEARLAILFYEKKAFGIRLLCSASESEQESQKAQTNNASVWDSAWHFEVR